MKSQKNNAKQHNTFFFVRIYLSQHRKFFEPHGPYMANLCPRSRWFGELLARTSFCWVAKVVSCKSVELQNFWVAAVVSCKGFELQTFWVANVLSCKILGLQKFWVAKVMNCKSFELQKFWIAKLSSCRSWKIVTFFRNYLSQHRKFFEPHGPIWQI